MKWASGISENSDFEGALKECTSQVLEQIGSTGFDLGMVFVSSHYQQDIPRLFNEVRDVFGSPLIMGC